MIIFSKVILKIMKMLCEFRLNWKSKPVELTFKGPKFD
jgi:hypothetical protein